MGVPVELLKCVCFLCVKRPHRGPEGFQYGGTAFFVSVPSGVDPSVSYIYLVTARDNVEEAQEAGNDLYIRLNRHNQAVDYLKIDLPWIMPEKGGVDLAIQGPYL